MATCTMAEDLEFFEELREHVGEEAARVIVRRTVSTDSLATKTDLKGLEAATKTHFHELEVRVLGAIHASDEQHRQAESQMFRWMLTFNTSQWLALVGMIVAIVLKG